MESNYHKDRMKSVGNSEGKVNSRSFAENSPQGNNWSRSSDTSYGRDNASMRGNDYYGSQGINSDYGRGNYSNSTYGAGARGDFSGGTRYGEGGSTFGGGSAYGQSRYGVSGNRGGYSGHRNSNQSENVRNGYGDFSDFGSRNNYGKQAGNQSYSDFINHNYGSRSSDRSRYSSGYNNSIGGYGNTGYGSTSYNNRDKDRARSVYGNSSEGAPYKSTPQDRYSENDGRRR